MHLSKKLLTTSASELNKVFVAFQHFTGAPELQNISFILFLSTCTYRISCLANYSSQFLPVCRCS